MSVMFKTNELV